MKELKINHSALVIRSAFLVFVLIVQASAVLLSSIRGYLILVSVMKGMNCILVLSFAYFVYKIVNQRNDDLLQVCIESAGAFLAVILYKDFLDRVAGDVVPNRFMMMPYIVSVLVSVGFRILVDNGFFNCYLKNKILVGFRFVMLLSSCLLWLSSIYFMFWLKNGIFPFGLCLLEF